MSELSKRMRELAEASAVANAPESKEVAIHEITVVDEMRDFYEACDEGVLALCAEVEALETENARLRAALTGLKIRGECWCECAVDPPNMRGRHSSKCEAARKTLDGSP